MVATITVQPPRRLPRKGGLSSAAEFITESRLLVGALPVYDALPCVPTVGEISLCYAPVTVDAKEADGIAISEGIMPSFGGYVGVECFIGPWDDYAERARASLELTQDRLLEDRLNTWLIDEADPITGGTTWVETIASLENAADNLYLGQPVILLNRGDAVRAAAEFAIFPDDSYDGRLWTANGTPVVSSSMLSPNFVSATGGITVLQSDIVVSEGFALPFNRNMAIAERAYNIIIDCDFAVRAPLTS